MFTLWLPPNVWLHGSQSTTTGGSSARNGQTWRIACWLAHSIRCVVVTAFGWKMLHAGDDPEEAQAAAEVATLASAGTDAMVFRICDAIW